jgi:hypothetical protein
MKECDPYLGRPRLMPERVTAVKPERGVSSGRISRRQDPSWVKTEGEGPNEEESWKS